MTRQDYTDITFVLDRSGSMECIAEATIAAFNRFVSEQKMQPGAVTFTLVQFDDQYELVHDAVPLAAVPELTAATFVPRGATALLDAVGRRIEETGQRLAAMPEHERPGHVIFVVLTDGEENASSWFTANEVLSKVRHQESVYNWQFIFLGANQDAIATAATMGISADAALTYDASDAGVTASVQSLSDQVTRRRRTGERTRFTDLDRTIQSDIANSSSRKRR